MIAKTGNETMPYSNEHACRLRSPKEFRTFGRGTRDSASHDGKQYAVIRGQRADGSWEDQAYRYDKDRWTAAEAGAHCRAHNGSFEAARADNGQVSSDGVRNSQSTLGSYTMRAERLDGRDHIVVPTVILIEGVHNGIFYPADELARFVEAWNGRPVPVFHPRDGDTQISANNPSVIESRCVGRLFNTRYEDGKLKSEIWIDVIKIADVSPATLSMIRAGRRLEVSTALFGEEDGIAGVWNGEEYVTTLRNYHPDHLALLPGEVGACSWDDGCGVRDNQSEKEERMNKEEDGKSGGPNLMIAALQAMKSSGLTFSINAEIGHGQIHRDLQALIDRFDTDNLLHFLVEVFDGDFIYESRGMNPSTGMSGRHLYRRDYVSSADGSIALGEVAQEVREKIEYVSIGSTNNASKEGDSMNKDKVNTLIACPRTRLVECDRSWLETLSDGQLDKFEAVPEEKAPDPMPVPKTMEEFVATAPDDFKPILNRALAREAEIKATFVDAIAANAANKFTREELVAMDVVNLGHIAALAHVDVNYAGQAGGPAKPPETNVSKVPDPPPLFTVKSE